MFKLFAVVLLAIGLCGGATIQVSLPNGYDPILPIDPTETDFWAKWGPEIMDFVALIDADKVITVILKNISDPEVLDFVGFLLGPKLPEVVFMFESMEEFKEAYVFLASKGYDLKQLINIINSVLEIPPFEAKKGLQRSTRGISSFIEDLIAALPVEEMRALFENKLETNEELADLFYVINSDEFIDILHRMHLNPTFNEIKGILEAYGFDFKYLCMLAKEILGEYYVGVFCE